VATPEKVLELIKVSDLDAQLTMNASKVICRLGGFISRQEAEMKGDKFIACQQNIFELIKKRLHEFFVNKCAEQFSDQELDELIETYNSPAFKHLVSLMPRMMLDVSGFLLDKEPDFKQEIIKFYQRSE
jgi:hypothetical protein